MDVNCGWYLRFETNSITSSGGLLADRFSTMGFRCVFIWLNMANRLSERVVWEVVIIKASK